MSTAPVPTQKNNEQARIPKNIVSDPGQFDRDKTKFKDWWRGMRLFFKSNRVMKTNNKIMTILAYLKKGIASIYAQKKLNELDKETETQNWDDFV